MKRIIAATSVLIILIMSGCKDNSLLPEPVEHEPLIPLSVGNHWIYKEYDLDPETGAERDTSLWRFGFIIHNPSEYVIDGKKETKYQMSSCGDNLKPLDDSFYMLYGGSKMVYQNKNGFYYSSIIRKDTVTMTFNDLIFPYPVEKGKSVSGHVFYYSTVGNYSNVPDKVITQYTCVSTDSLFTTPLGDLRCIVYKMPFYDIENIVRGEVYYFIKPSIGIVGMVQMIYHYNTNKYRYFMKYVLTDYQIK